MKKTIFLLLVFALLGGNLFAQSARKDVKRFNEALEYISNDKYMPADDILTALLAKDKNNLDYVFNKGICELYLGKEDKAISRFNQIIDDYNTSKVEKNATKSAIFYKAKTFHNLYQFDEEIEVLNMLNSFELKENEKTNLEQALEKANNAKEIFFDFKPIIVTRLDILNSDYDDHTPIPTAGGDKLYFTSKRPGGVSGDALSEEGKYYEDIWFWNGKDNPVNVGPPINTMGHDATGGLSLDGKTIFIYRTKENKGGDLYSSNLNSEGKWEEPVKLNISKKRPVERHAALSPDGKRLYFSSDKKGGKGGRDIWMSEKNEDGTWGTPVDININTKYDEEAPYLLSDGVTFYFSSKGYKNMGGYDIFKCTLNSDGTFSEPQNIGFPVNTVEDDVFFFPVTGEDVAYFTRRNTNDADIYKTMFPKNTVIVESTVKGKDTGKDLNIKDTDINIYDVNSETKPDVYTLKLKEKYKSVVIPDKDYKFVYESDGYVFDTKDISIEDMEGKDLVEKYPVLVKIETGKTEKYKNLGFENGSSDLNNYTSKELDVIAENLKKYDSLVVNFSTEKYELESSDLSKERKNKAIKYLENAGISEYRIYTDLSSRNIPENQMEYTIYDKESVGKAFQDKQRAEEESASKYYSVTIHNLYFRFGNSNMESQKNPDLDSLCTYLKNNPNAEVSVIGYTDAVGSAAYNDILAQQRASDVRTYMIKSGVKENQVKIIGFGEDNPVAYNKKDGRYYEPSKKFNRRVEFRIINQGVPTLKILQFKELPSEYKDPDYNSNYER